ncbi:Ku protein [Ancylobacter sp. G4_0304]|uniref:non-homologous end joining protein Ku n=1 Tax=Ancylobacter sp. G4_0304 TaxID=3114289 RepID=UPI0039C67E3A
MATHSFWKGYLKLSLVTCPVAMAPATTESEKIRFHTLNKATGNRVEAVYVDAESGSKVDDDDQARGYERDSGQFVVLEEDELRAVALKSTRTIEIERFVPADSVGWLWYDKPHFLTPDDPVGEEAYAVIREAMAATKTVGLSRLVLYRRERPVMLEPRGRGIVLWTLHYADELRAPEPYFEEIDGEPDPELLTLISRLIDRRTRQWDDELVRDPMQDNLRALIEAKKKKRPPAKSRRRPTAETPTNVVNIMDALKKSLAAEGKGSRAKR